MSEHVQRFLEDIGVVETTIVVSPYLPEQENFSSEQQAYEHFNNVGGINAYVIKLIEVVKAFPNLKHMIGFSAGAAALYRVMSDKKKTQPPMTLFYPGQIRHFLDKQPFCDCKIIFPAFEEHFNLDHVMAKLKQHKNIKLTQSDGLHGFMNQSSINFNRAEYAHNCELLVKYLSYNGLE
jgi:hypothetical protein